MMTSPDITPREGPPVLVLGLGNLLCGDDGAGVAAVEALRARYRWDPDALRVLDGGTLGLALLPWLLEARHVVLVDAVVDDAPAGTLLRLDGQEVAPAARQRLSVHQVGVADLLDGARLLGQLPPLVLVGVVAEDLSLRVGCSPAVAAALDALVEAVATEVRAAGVALERQEAA